MVPSPSMGGRLETTLREFSSARDRGEELVRSSSSGFLISNVRFKSSYSSLLTSIIVVVCFFPLHKGKDCRFFAIDDVSFDVDVNLSVEPGINQIFQRTISSIDWYP